MPNIVIPATTVVLPYYIRAHWSPTAARYTYRWELNGRLKKSGFMPHKKLFGTDLALAIRTAEEELLPALYAYIGDERAVALSSHPAMGTVDALIQSFMEDDAFTSLRMRTRKSYAQALRAGANHVFRSGPYEGRRLGSLLVSQVDVKVTRLFMAEFSKVAKPTDDGEIIEQKRDGQANYVKTTCGTMFNAMYGIDDDVPYENPFGATRRRRHKKKKTVHAAIEDLAFFIVAARALGMPNLAVAAWFAFEFEMRVESILTGLMVQHYKPDHRKNEVLITHYKTDEEVWVSLYDSDGEPLYPGIEAALDELKGDRTSGVLIPRDGSLNPWAGPEEQLPGDFYKTFDEVAGKKLRAKGITFTSFRHGGITEGAEAGLTEFELMTLSGHKDPRTIQKYVKQTRRMFENAQHKRILHRSRVIASLKRQGLLDGSSDDTAIQEVLALLPPVPKPKG
jgi:integrase